MRRLGRAVQVLHGPLGELEERVRQMVWNLRAEAHSRRACCAWGAGSWVDKWYWEIMHVGFVSTARNTENVGLVASYKLCSVQ